jgi:hypothetical protein
MRSSAAAAVRRSPVCEVAPPNADTSRVYSISTAFLLLLLDGHSTTRSLECLHARTTQLACLPRTLRTYSDQSCSLMSSLQLASPAPTSASCSGCASARTSTGCCCEAPPAACPCRARQTLPASGSVCLSAVAGPSPLFASVVCPLSSLLSPVFSAVPSSFDPSFLPPLCCFAVLGSARPSSSLRR